MRKLLLFFLVLLTVSCGTKKIKTKEERSVVESVQTNITEQGITLSSDSSTYKDNSKINYSIEPTDPSKPIVHIKGKDTTKIYNARILVENQKDIQSESNSQSTSIAEKETQNNIERTEEVKTQSKQKRNYKTPAMLTILGIVILLLFLYRKRF